MYNSRYMHSYMIHRKRHKVYSLRMKHILRSNSLRISHHNDRHKKCGIVFRNHKYTHDSSHHYIGLRSLSILVEFGLYNCLHM